MSLFYLSGFFGLMAAGCGLWGMLVESSPFVFVLGCGYAAAAAAYFVLACLLTALA